MGDEALIRRETLRRVMKDRGLTLRDLERIVGGRYTYWRDVLAEGSTKSFGEKAARKVEEKLDPPLPRGYLDSPVGRAPVAPPATQAGPPAPPPAGFKDRRGQVDDSDWDLLQDVKLLSPEEIRSIRERAKLVRSVVDAEVERRMKVAADSSLPSPPTSGAKK